MCLIGLLMLRHASYKLHDTTWRKLKRIGRVDENIGEKNVPSLSGECAMPFHVLSLCTVTHSPHACAISLPAHTAWKSQHTSPSTSLCLTHTGSLLLYTVLIIFIVPFPSLSALSAFNLHKNIFSAQFLSSYIPTHASMLPVCLAAPLSCKYLAHPLASSTAAASCGPEEGCGSVGYRNLLKPFSSGQRLWPLLTFHP